MLQVNKIYCIFCPCSRILQAMTLKRVQLEFSRLQDRREAVERQEAWIQKVVGDFIREQNGSLRETAGKMGLTIAYVSDIVHGRRKISKGVMQALEKLQ